MPDYVDLLKSAVQSTKNFFTKGVNMKQDDPVEEKLKYEDVIDEIKQLASQMWDSSDAVTKENARRRFNEIKSQLSKADQESVENLAADLIVSQASNSAQDDIDEQQKKIMKDAVKSNLALSGVKTLTGLIQVIDGAFKKKGLQPPKFPPRLVKNSQLQTQIARTQVLANEGDPAIRAQFESDLAEQAAIDQAQAQATGNIGAFSSLLQASANRANDARRAFAADEAKRKAGVRTELNSLLRTDMLEDQYIQADAWKRFNSDKEDYVASMTNVQNQINSGFSNMFQGLNEGAAAAPYANLLGGKKTTPPADENYNALIGGQDEPVSQQASRPLTNAEMIMLGNGANRSEMLTALFQDNIKRMKGQQEIDWGKWGEGDATDEAWFEQMEFSPYNNKSKFEG